MAKPSGNLAQRISRAKLSNFMLKDYILRWDMPGLAKEIMVLRRWKSCRQLAFDAAATIPEEPLSVTGKGKVGVFIHAFYIDELSKLVSAIARFEKPMDLFITTNSQKNQELIHVLLQEAGLHAEVRVTPNVGRNFGPFLVEFSKQVLNYETIIHFHTKQSRHSKDKLGKEWADRHFQLFFGNQEVSARCHALLKGGNNISIVYPDVSDLVSPANFRFGESLSRARALTGGLKKSGKTMTQEPFAFPAGGMFWLRVEHYKELFALDWKYEMFPREAGQLDGTTQHAVERLFGWHRQSANTSHAIYCRDLDAFITDQAFLEARAGHPANLTTP